MTAAPTITTGKPSDAAPAGSPFSPTGPARSRPLAPVRGVAGAVAPIGGVARAVAPVRGVAGAVAPIGGVAGAVAPVVRRGVLATGGATVQNLLRERIDLPAGHPGRLTLRDRAIEAGIPLSRYLAAKYRGRGEPVDDLYQVAALGLIKAVDGYDAARPVAFTSYAVPTIVGALKRHFRDTTWAMRVPRRIQELALALGPASAGLSQQFGRSPTRTELAAHLGATEPDVAVALNAWADHHPGSLDALPADGGQGHRALHDTAGDVDARFDAVADHYILQRLLARLPLRERRILVMRFSDDMTQTEIAAQIGVSQMQISRLLVRTLAALRAGMLAQEHPRAVHRKPDQHAGRSPDLRRRGTAPRFG